MYVKALPLGLVAANCYIICDDKGNGAVIDPGDYTLSLEAEIIKSGIKNLKYIICTHGHFDHISGVKELKAHHEEALVVIGEEDAPCLSDNYLSEASFFGVSCDTCYPDLTVKDGDTLELGEIIFKVISVPGHTRGGIFLHCENEKVAFTGDTLFKGSVGRTDLKGGSYAQLMKSVSKIKSFSPDTALYCGHGESTNVEYELKYNLYLV